MGFFRRYTTRSAQPLRARPGGGSGTGKLGGVRIFTDAQAVITRVTHDEPDPGQTYALQVGKAIAALRFCRDRDPLVPRTQRGPWERGAAASRMAAGPSGWRLLTATGYPHGQPP